MNILKPSVEFITDVDERTVLKTIEAAGRTCYKSEDKITDDSCYDFVKRILASGHEAVIEHYNVTVKISCDRGVSHEIVRHRLASFCQSSTRYCNYSKDKFGNEVSYIDLGGGIELDPKMKDLDSDTVQAIITEWYDACVDAEKHYMRMLELGATPQISRSVLNNSTQTDLCITMNLREWRHFFKLRTGMAAHPQMREIALEMLRQFKGKLPTVFNDIDEHN